MNREVLLVIYAIVLVIFLCLSFFFSSADMAYGSVDQFRFKSALEKTPEKEKKILRGKELALHYDRTIATILFCNDMVNAGLDSVATLFGVNLCMLLLSDHPNVLALSDTWGLVTSMVVLVMKITFGEIVPKSISKVINLKLSILYSGVIKFLIYLFTPLTFPIAKLADLLARLFSKNVVDVSIAEDDLHEMVDDIENQGSVDEEKASMLHETIKYTRTEAKEVMTPRVDIIAIDKNDDIEEIIKEGKIFRHSRIPVYENTIDNIIGFITVKSLMAKYLNQEEIVLDELLIEPLRFPQSKEINDIMRIFKKKKRHFAIIMDEYGGVDGILTMEDILEEIVGEIWDERDRPNDPIVERKDHSYIIDGTVTVEDFCDLFEIPFEGVNTDYLTVAGFIVELLGDHFAKVNDILTFEGVQIKVIAIDENGAVSRVLCKKIEEEDK
ncbi:MAG: hemolysin family protein [Candidatus Enterosoma sp.]|nr:hemolysin family protein [Candidatus Enterosoma sp.]